MSGTTIEAGPDVSDQANFVAVEMVQTANTHVGTPTSPFSTVYNGAVIQYPVGIAFIADIGLYNSLVASGAPVTWND
jgi:hypothetical protein